MALLKPSYMLVLINKKNTGPIKTLSSKPNAMPDIIAFNTILKNCSNEIME